MDFLVFNELSFYRKPDNERQAIEILKEFLNVCKKARELGFSKLFSENIFWNEIFFKKYTLLNFVGIKLSPTSKSFLLSYIRKPYLTEEGSDADDKFIENDYFL